MSAFLLEVDHLKVYYKSILGLYKAVDDVSFHLSKNTIFGIAGESGCGKSTLVEGILRLIEPPGYIAGGRVLFEGRDILKLSDEELREVRWKEISYVPQGSMNSLNPIMRIEDQMIDAILAHEDISKEEAKEQCLKLLYAVGLSEETLKMYPHELSGGMKQRVIIAMAMSLSPKLIVADEPVTALDVTSQRAVLETLRDIRDKIGASVIFVAHDIAAHAALVDELMMMYAGKVCEIGDVFEIFREPLHPYTEALLSSVPSLEEKKMIKGIHGMAPSPLNWPTGCRFHPRCPKAKDICKKICPQLIEVEKGRWVACHLFS